MGVPRDPVTRHEQGLACPDGGSPDGDARRLLAALPDPVIECDAAGRIRFVSSAWVDLLGYGPDETRGRPLADFLDEPVSLATAAPAVGDAPVELDWPLRHKAGHRRWMAASLRRLQDGGVVISLRNVGARRRAAERLEALVATRTAEADQFFELANDAMLVFDPDSELILRANQRACALYGSRRDELVGRSLKSLTRDVARGEAEIRSVLERGSSEGFESTHVRPDGREIRVLANASRVQYRGRPAILAIIRDVTEERRVQAQLLQAQKLESLGRLAAGVAHDFNNLLTIILGTCEHLLDAAPETTRRELLDIKQAAERAAHLTSQLLAFSRQQTAEPRIVSLTQAVAAVQGLLHRVLGEDVHLDVRLPAHPVPVRLDPSQFEQVLINLAVNARDAMPGGGCLSLTVRLVSVSPEWSAIGPLAPGRYALLEVSDTGTGMTPDVLAQVFEPFFTTKGSNGTGLGLSTVYGIVQQHGGHISVDSAPGRGTTFSVYFPLVEGAAVAAGDASDPADREGQGSETILVVEDDPAVRGLVARALRRFGYTVLEAEGADAAWHLCADAALAIDLLLCDLVLPTTSGPALAEQLRALRPALKILFMSGYGDHPLREQAGDVEIVPKPFRAETLAARIRACLDGGPGASAPLTAAEGPSAGSLVALGGLRQTGWYWIGSLTAHPWH